MIQRIQTIWLLLAALTVSSLLIFPMVTTTVGSDEYQVLATGLYQKASGEFKQLESYLPLMIATLAVALMSLANIFNFKNRTAQKRVIMANVALIIGLSFWCSVYAKKIPGGLEVANYNVGMFAPAIAIFFCILALRGINNDEKLIRSADRLR